MTRPALIFDLDGTLSDPSDGIVRCMRHALEHVGAEIPSDAALHRSIGPPLQAIFAEILDEARAAVAVRAFRECYGNNGLFENRLYPGIAEAIDVLHRLSPAMFVATSKPHVFADRILQRFALRPFFRAVHGCEMTGERADKTELLQHVLREEQLDGGNTIMVGDRMYDILAARANGIRSVGVTWGFGSVEELREARADTLCSSVADLVQWYQSV